MSWSQQVYELPSENTVLRGGGTRQHAVSMLRTVACPGGTTLNVHPKEIQLGWKYTYIYTLEKLSMYRYYTTNRMDRFRKQTVHIAPHGGSTGARVPKGFFDIHSVTEQLTCILAKKKKKKRHAWLVKSGAFHSHACRLLLLRNDKMLLPWLAFFFFL